MIVITLISSALVVVICDIMLALTYFAFRLKVRWLKISCLSFWGILFITIIGVAICALK